MSHLLKNLLIVTVAVVLFGAVYMYMSKSSDGVVDVADSADISARTAEILANTQKINSYKLDTSIFEDARFASLKDTRVNIPDVPTGRTNPFAPIQ